MQTNGCLVPFCVPLGRTLQEPTSEAGATSHENPNWTWIMVLVGAGRSELETEHCSAVLLIRRKVSTRVLAFSDATTASHRRW